MQQKIITLTEDAKFKLELLEKIENLKKISKNSNLDKEKVIKIQSLIRGIIARRDLEFKKNLANKTRNTINLTKKYLIRDEDLYFLLVDYLKKENSLVFRAVPFKHFEQIVENKQKLFELFSINEMRHFAETIILRVF